MEHSFITHGAAIAVAALLTTGCVASEVRRGADLLAAFTHQVSEEAADLVRSRTLLAQARRANIVMLKESAVELENGVTRDIETWRLARGSATRRVELLEGIRAYANSTSSRSQELSEVRKKHEAAIAAEKSAVDVRQAELSKVSKALAGLAQTPDLASEIKFYTTYFKEVSAGIKKAKEQAGQSVKAAQASAQNVAPPNDQDDQTKK